MNGKRNDGARGGSALRFVRGAIASGALAALLLSSSPAMIYASSDAATGKGSVHSQTQNVNNNFLYPGVTIADGKISYKLPGINSKNIWSYKALNLTVGGKKLTYPALSINSTVYVPLREAASAIGAKVSYSSSSRTMTVSAPGLLMTATDGGYVTYANGRTLFSFSPNVIMSNGRMYIAASTFAKATGLTLSHTSSSASLGGTLKPILSADKYYKEDEVFWLARIITAEAKGESLLGQIAVGNVIMNRVASRQYPNTIYGVIFDRKWGVQFSPVLDGSIYNTPTYTATLAAKIILEGTKLSNDSLFFLNPLTAESNWIVKSREYLYTIGGHDFYS